MIELNLENIENLFVTSGKAISLLMELLENPPEPNDALKRLFKN